MSGRRVAAAAAVGVCALLVLGAGAGSSVSRWKLTDLGTVAAFRHRASVENRPVAVNGQGEIAGTSSISSRGGPLESGPIVTPERAFAWQHGKLTELGKASAAGINDRGEIVGGGPWPSGHALLWRGGKTIDLGTLGGRSSEAVGVNGRGQVIGTSEVPGGTPRSPHEHAFLWQDGKLTDLGTLGGANSRAVAINDRGQVIGVSDTAAPQHRHGFLWQHGKMTDLGTLGGWTSDPVAINEHGQIIGQSTTAKGTAHAFVGDAFLWQRGKMIELGRLPSHPVCHHKPVDLWCGTFRTEATAINDKGQIVGNSEDAALNQRAFLWQDGKMTSLGTLGGKSSGATGISDRGEIVGTSATKTNWVAEAFVWANGKMTDLGAGNAIAIGAAGDAIIGERLVGTVTRDSFSTNGATRALLWTRTR